MVDPFATTHIHAAPQVPLASRLAAWRPSRRLIAGTLGVAGLFLCLGVGWTAWSLAQQFRTPAPPPIVDLDFVRTDVDALISVRVAEVWNSPFIQDAWRRLDPELRRQTDDNVAMIGLEFDDFDRVTFVLQAGTPPVFYAVLNSLKPYTAEDRERMLKANVAEGDVRWETRTYREIPYDLAIAAPKPGAPDQPFAVHIVEDRIFIVGPEAGVQLALDHWLKQREPKPADPDAPAPPHLLADIPVLIASGEHQFVMAGAISPQSRQLLDGQLPANVPPQLQPLLKVQAAWLAADIDADRVLHLAAWSKYPLPDDAQKARDMLAGLVSLVKLAPPPDQKLNDKQRRVLTNLQNAIDQLRITTDDTLVEMQTRLEVAEVLAEAGQAVAIQFDPIGEQNLTSQSQLKRLAEAFHDYHRDHGHYPAALQRDARGRPLWSWRVAILPYLGEEAQALHREFHLDEPWDSPHNKALLPRMPREFSHPLATLQKVPEGYTSFMLPVGPDALFHQDRQPTEKDVADGPAGTILLVDHVPLLTPWTQPADAEVSADPERLKPLLTPHPGIGELLTVVLCDGTPRNLKKADLTPATLWQALAPRDGGVLPPGK